MTTPRGQEIIDSLTKRERHIAQLVCTGAANRAIAAEVGTTEQVVKNYCIRIWDKAGVNSKLEFIVLCAEHGMFRAVKPVEGNGDGRHTGVGGQPEG